jgi:starvation-inducible DNA-binding protein
MNKSSVRRNKIRNNQMATNKSPLSTGSNGAIAAPLQKLWADNFLVYFKSHIFHFNIQGPTFLQDHMLFQEIYEYLWESHDTLGETIRQLDKPVLTSLEQLISASSVDEAEPSVKDSKSMMIEMNEELDELIESTQALYDLAEDSGYAGVATMLGDYSKALNKLNWKVKASAGKSIK